MNGRSNRPIRLTIALLAGSLLPLLGTACSSDSTKTAPESTGSGSVASGPLPASADVHGVDATTIEIGLYSVSAAELNDAAAAAAGNQDAQVAASGADKVQAAVVDYINANGGIAGRQVKPVYYRVKAQNLLTAEGRRSEAQAACAKWTEDRHVFAFDAFIDRLLFDCAAAATTPFVTGVIASPTLSAAQFPSVGQFWYSPTNFRADRRERAMANFLVKRKFFAAGAKVALIVEDSPERRAAVDSDLKPALRAAGVEPVVEIDYPDSISSPWPNYVLQLQAAGVTHVVFSGSAASLFPPMSMMRAAEEQQYRPQWAMASDNNPDGLITLGKLPATQLQNVLGMGWLPTSDVGDTAGQGPNGRLCDKIATDIGQPPTGGGTCDFLFFLKAALEHATEVSPAGVARGAQQLHDSFKSTATIDGATNFTGDRHDGVSVVREVRYDPAKPDHMSYVTRPEIVSDH